MNRTSDVSTSIPVIQTPKLGPGRVIAVVLLLAIGVGILDAAMTTTEALNRDFTEYWAVGHQLVHRRNPYDSRAIVSFLQAAGSKATVQTHMILRNPPSALFITLPLGFVGVRAGAILWSLALTSCPYGVNSDALDYARPPSGSTTPGWLHVRALPGMYACGATRPFSAFWGDSVPVFSRVQTLYCRRCVSAMRTKAASLPAVRCRTDCMDGGAQGFSESSKKGPFTPFSVGEHCRDTFSRSFGVVPLCALGAGGEHSKLVHPLHERIVPPEDFYAIGNAVWLQILPEVAGCVWGVWYFWTRRDRWNWV